MNILEKFKIGVPKRVLFFIASLVWMMAGYNILKIAFEEMVSIKSMYLLSIGGGLLGFYAFFKFVFFKMYKKHTKRIINGKSDRPCMFSFFDIKSFIIMAFMITLGITIRSSHLISGLPLIILYLSLGLALSSAAVAFFMTGVNYKIAKEKYLIVE